MLSSIHPLGERTRHNRWWLTVTAFTVASVLGGALPGALLGWLGSVTLPPGSWQGWVAVAVVIAAGAADLAGIRPPGPRRQVDKDWIGTFRGWVYGAGFGAQLGAGVATFVVTWGVWAVLILELLTASPGAGAGIGAVFGLGRATAPIAAGWIDRPSRLTSFNRGMATMGNRVATGTAAALVVAGFVAGAWL